VRLEGLRSGHKAQTLGASRHAGNRGLELDVRPKAVDLSFEVELQVLQLE